jgi:hypothetical protein
MAAPSPSPAVLQDENQSAIQHEVQQLHTDLENVHTGLQKLRSELLPDIKRVYHTFLFYSLHMSDSSCSS